MVHTGGAPRRRRAVIQDVLQQTDHLPGPLPRGPWVMVQVWHDLLFAHWSVPADALARLLPDGLELDLFEGRAWVAVVPFRMSGIRLRGLPAVPGLSRFPELNVRTYVRCGGRGGVYFFSLDAANAVAVAVARTWFHLPYFRARMACDEVAPGRLRYASERTHSGAHPAGLRGEYGPAEEARVYPPDSLEHWLTERYSLFADAPDGSLRRGDIHHPPWELAPAWAELEENTMTAPQGLTLPDEPPLLHFARLQRVVIWAPHRVPLR